MGPQVFQNVVSYSGIIVNQEAYSPGFWLLSIQPCFLCCIQMASRSPLYDEFFGSNVVPKCSSHFVAGLATSQNWKALQSEVRCRCKPIQDVGITFQDRYLSAKKHTALEHACNAWCQKKHGTEISGPKMRSNVMSTSSNQFGVFNTYLILLPCFNYYCI